MVLRLQVEPDGFLASASSMFGADSVASGTKVGKAVDSYCQTNLQPLLSSRFPSKQRSSPQSAIFSDYRERSLLLPLTSVRMRTGGRLLPLPYLINSRP